MSHTTELFIMAAVWCVISAVIVRFVAPGWPARIGLFAILVGVPFWELPYGYFNFTQLCDQHARVIAYEKVVPQESICFEDFYEDVYGTVARAGITQIEVRGRTNFREKNTTTAQVVRVTRGSEKSLYCYESRANIPLPWRILRHDSLITGAKDGRVVLKLSQFVWSGMWWQEQAAPVLGNGGRCWAPMMHLFEAVRNGST
jgi:hypothetical protein